MVAFSACESSASLLNYSHSEVPAVRKWVQEFVDKLGKLSGNNPGMEISRSNGNYCTRNYFNILQATEVCILNESNVFTRATHPFQTCPLPRASTASCAGTLS